MRLLNFIPKVGSSYRSIKTYSSYRESELVSAEATLLKDVLTGKRRSTYKQTEWMGRGCFKKIKKNSYIIGKGTGPGPGSEQMRQLLDQMWMRRTKNGFGGCIRIDSNAYYPILLQYQKNKNKWNVIDPRPEGFSIFGALAREAEAGEVYKKIGIDIITPVSLLRNKTLPPWKEVKSSSGLVNFIQKSFPIALKERCDVTLSGKVSVIEMEESGYWELDGGVLVRHGKTPYRIVNLHFALINKDRETLEYLTKETRSALKEMLDILEREQKQELDMFLVKKLGRAAGRLFTQGVIHGQLNIHYQNVSIVGEFSDFDSSIFLNNYSEIVENIPLPKIEESIMKAHNKFIQSIDKLEKTQKVHIKKFIDFDLAKYSKSKVTDSLEEERLAMFMLGQIYDIYNHAVKMYDLLGRFDRKDFAKKGTILTKYELNKVRSSFLNAFAAEIKNGQASELLTWAIQHGTQSFLKTYLNKRGKNTIYGWQMKGVPLNHLLEECSSLRNKFIRQEGEILLGDLTVMLNKIV